jgi:competence protein ComEC
MVRMIVPVLLGFLAGSALQLQQATLFPGFVYGLMVLAAVLLWLGSMRVRRVYGGPVVMATLALAVLAFGLTGLRGAAFLEHALDAGLEQRDVTVVGVVAAMPQQSVTGARFQFDVESAWLAGQSVRLPPRIQLSWYAGSFGFSPDAAQADALLRAPGPVQAGERWQLTVRLKAPHGGSNPFSFDFELWLWEQGIQATGYVRTGPKDPPPLRLAQTVWHPVEQLRQRVRAQIYQDVAERRYAGLIAALVLGDQNAIERSDWAVFRTTGVAHLMSISGLHVTMFAWLAALFVDWLWRRSERLCLWLAAPSAALVGGVLLAVAYALFSGWGVPSQRTVLMLAVVGLLRLSGKQWPWPCVWLLACVAVVVLDPWALLQAGFWLSFVAVGVLFASDSGAGRVRPPRAKDRLLALFREQWVITLALTPLTLLLFGQVSLVSLVANALAIPLVTLVITPLAMLGIFLAPLWYLSALVMASVVWYLQLLAALPFSTIFIAQAPIWVGAAGVVGGLLLTLQLPMPLRMMGLPLLIPVLLWQAPRPPVGQFELLASDIGQGSAVLVRTAKHALLYDAGPRFSATSDAGDRVLVPLLRALGVSLDRVVLSHRDSDHVGGALAVLGVHRQADLLSSIEDDHELQTVRPATRCMAGQQWRWDGVAFEVLHPRNSDYAMGLSPNAMSCVLRISNGVVTALLTGDIPRAQEARLLNDGAQLLANVLLVPHHGSKTSSSSAFLDAVQPQIALVQAGYRNHFGHPAEPVLVRYAERSIVIVDSPHCGAATWQSWQPKIALCQRLQVLRYWHHRLPCH